MNLSDIEKMSVEERLQLVDVILDSISDAADQRSLPPTRLKLIRERLAKFRASGTHGEPAREAIERICGNL